MALFVPAARAKWALSPRQNGRVAPRRTGTAGCIPRNRMYIRRPLRTQRGRYRRNVGRRPVFRSCGAEGFPLLLLRRLSKKR